MMSHSFLSPNLHDLFCVFLGGTEKYFRKNFQQQFPESIVEAQVGFMGDKTAKKNPNYKEVCSGQTGHVEVRLVNFFQQCVCEKFISQNSGSHLSKTNTCISTTSPLLMKVLSLKYDPSKCKYEDLVRFFFSFHDPTTDQRQGNDTYVTKSNFEFYGVFCFWVSYIHVTYVCI